MGPTYDADFIACDGVEAVDSVGNILGIHLGITKHIFETFSHTVCPIDGPACKILAKFSSKLTPHIAAVPGTSNTELGAFPASNVEGMKITDRKANPLTENLASNGLARG